MLYFIQDTGRRLGNELTVRAREGARVPRSRRRVWRIGHRSRPVLSRVCRGMWQVTAVVEDQDEQRCVAAARLGMFLARAAPRRVDLSVQWQAEMDRGAQRSREVTIPLSVKGEGAAGAASLRATGDTASNGRSFYAMLLEAHVRAAGDTAAGAGAATGGRSRSTGGGSCCAWCRRPGPAAGADAPSGRALRRAAGALHALGFVPRGSRWSARPRSTRSVWRIGHRSRPVHARV